MQALIKQNLAQVQQLCHQHKIRFLWLFGSATGNDFHSGSDIDLLYELNHDQLTGQEHLDHFFGFADSLAELLGRKIDLVWYPGIKNPYFLEEVDETKVLLYESEREKISV